MKYQNEKIKKIPFRIVSENNIPRNKLNQGERLIH